MQRFEDPDSKPVAWSASLRDGQLVGSWSGGVAGTFTAVRQSPDDVTTSVLSKVAAKGVALPALSAAAQAPSSVNATGDGPAPSRRARVKPQRTTAKSPPGSRPRSRGRASRGRSSQEESSVAVLCGDPVSERETLSRSCAASETSVSGAGGTAEDVLRVAKARLAAQLAAEQKTVEASRALAESMNQHLSLEQLEAAVSAAEEAGLDRQRDKALVAAKRRLAGEVQRQAEAAARLAEAMSRSQTAEEMKLAIMQAEQAGLVSGTEAADDVDLAERVRITRAHSVSEREEDLSRTAVSWTIWPTNRSRARDDGSAVKLAGTFVGVVAQAEEHRTRAFTQNAWSDSWEFSQRASRDLAGEAILLHLSSMLRSGDLFTDESFPPDDTSLFAAVKSGRGEISRADLMDQREFLSGVTDVTWRRAMDIGDLRRKPVVFSGAIDPDDIRQGKLGDAYLLTAIANCATPQHDNLISDLIVEDGGMHGLYGVKLFVNGIWTTIVVDDWFPCEWRDGMWLPVFASSAQHFDPESDEKELWAMLIEKAFAKLHGSYQAIATGDVDDAQNYLTGGFVETTAVNSAQETHEWRAMLDLNVDDRSRPVFCTCSLREGIDEDAVEEVSGLLDAHSYSLLAVVESSQGHRLLKLRNRWSSGDWRGAFHNQDPIWTGRLMRDVGFEAVDDGTFWMSWPDFRRFFERIGTCDPWCDPLGSSARSQSGFWHRAVRGEWVADRNAGGSLGGETFDYNPHFLMVADGTGSACISMYQEDSRPRGQDDTWEEMTLYLLDPTPGKNAYPKAIIKLSSRQASTVVELEHEKEYVLVPALPDAGAEATFWITVCTNSAVEVSLQALKAPTGKAWREAVDKGLMSRREPDDSAGRRFARSVLVQRIPSEYEWRGVFARKDRAKRGVLSLRQVDQAITELYPDVDTKPALMRAFKSAAISEDSLVNEVQFGELIEFILHFTFLWDKFDEIDTRGSRRITLEEFQRGCHIAGLKISSAEASGAFSEMDTEETGVLLFDDCCTWYAKRQVFNDAELDAVPVHHRTVAHGRGPRLRPREEFSILSPVRGRTRSRSHERVATEHRLRSRSRSPSGRGELRTTAGVRTVHRAVSPSAARGRSSSRSPVRSTSRGGGRRVEHRTSSHERQEDLVIMPMDDVELPDRAFCKQLFAKLGSGSRTERVPLTQAGDAIIALFRAPEVDVALERAEHFLPGRAREFLDLMQFCQLLRCTVFFYDIAGLLDQIEDMSASAGERMTAGMFERACHIIQLPMTASKCTLEFAKVDTDRDGLITFDEFCAWGAELHLKEPWDAGSRVSDVSEKRFELLTRYFGRHDRLKTPAQIRRLLQSDDFVGLCDRLVAQYGEHPSETINSERVATFRKRSVPKDRAPITVMRRSSSRSPVRSSSRDRRMVEQPSPARTTSRGRRAERLSPRRSVSRSSSRVERAPSPRRSVSRSPMTRTRSVEHGVPSSPNRAASAQRAAADRLATGRAVTGASPRVRRVSSNPRATLGNTGAWEAPDVRRGIICSLA